MEQFKIPFFPELGFDVPYVPTPHHVVREMLKLAKAGRDDVLYDLGSGDGRVLIIAVEEFGVKKAVGIEIRRELVEISREEVKKRGLEGRVTIIHGNVLNVSFVEPTVVTMFLLPDLMEAIRRRLEKELPKNARVVSYEFPMASWKPTVVRRFEDAHSYHTLYLYVKGISF
ncbi:50S ribosomal protein L11 methyltransferase [Ignicoccus islandicus DSM 13165]|uniref:50S ribosomal protein L11 methyltransferase n=1 Tax=Ignicoccus islandicus DSM 13165 TaxID=940295 RepID=A0A0U3EAH6_9CREN|nr:class I SAM-dependent methyltransferase [Ignicoccus islandicus]ALU11427.1 50S ribosomal protein L11 methyltransferase [Ignicoccus islandicus DSM 13165]